MSTSIQTLGRERTEPERLIDLDIISRLYIQGTSTAEIVRQFGNERGEYKLSRKAIDRDLKEIKEMWYAKVAQRVSDVKAAQLAKIDLMESEAWDAWFRSKLDKQTSVTSVTNSQRGKESKMQTKKEGRNPASEYMKTIQWCVEMRLKLFGAFRDDSQMTFIDEMAAKLRSGEIQASSVLIAYPQFAKEVFDKARVPYPELQVING